MLDSVCRVSMNAEANIRVEDDRLVDRLLTLWRTIISLSPIS